MHRRTATLLALAASLALVPATGAAAAPTGRLLVTLEPGDAGAPVGRAAAGSLVTRAEGRLAGTRVPQLGLVTVRPEAGTSLATLARRLRAQPGVARVQPEQRAELRAVPNDPALVTQEPASGAPAGTPVQWWAQRQGLFAAWDVPQALDATVAVIDTGIDASHPEFAGRITSAVDLDQTPGRGPATVDETGHGTHVASMACAAAGNGIGIAGAGYGCKLVVVKTDLSDSSVAASIVQATDAGADAINMSFGTDGSTPVATAVKDAIQYAYDRDVVLVAAAADAPTDQQGYPSDVLQPTGTGGDLAEGLGLSVTAANVADQRASFAGFGSQVSLAAYGAWNAGGGGPRGLLGAFPGATTELDTGTLNPPTSACNCRTSFKGDSRFAYVQGTSMASPIVAATAAMVRRLNPDLSAAAIIRLLKETSRRAPGTRWEPNLGWGILDAGAAVNAARLIDRRAPATKVKVSTPRSSRLTLRLVGVDAAPPGVVASGIRSFDVYRSIDGRKVKRVARTSRRTLRLSVRRGPRYAFWAVATDRAGNREAAPARPDARIRLRRLG
ncbi:MAG: peptidase and in kexin sedolisin [Solirubrobacterales bacterium]|jgi:serine protease|nr:peptidase and in kexin sedolisin [Solirubrobacterales bacterium]